MIACNMFPPKLARWIRRTGGISCSIRVGLAASRTCLPRLTEECRLGIECERRKPRRSNEVCDCCVLIMARRCTAAGPVAAIAIVGREPCLSGFQLSFSLRMFALSFSYSCLEGLIFSEHSDPIGNKSSGSPFPPFASLFSCSSSSELCSAPCKLPSAARVSHTSSHSMIV